MDFVEKALSVHVKGEYDYTNTVFVNMSTPVEILCKKCGNYFTKTPSSHVYGRVGCDKCTGNSKGENLASEVLDLLEVDYKKQVRLNSCRNIRPLSFDFGVYKEGRLKLLIEIDGHHHYTVVAYNDDYKKAFNRFKKRLMLDKIKDDYCKSNNIPLLRVPYWKIDNIDIILERELNKHKLI